MRWRRCIRSSTSHRFNGLPLARFDLMRLAAARLRVTWRMVTAYTFAAAAIKAAIRVCDADHCAVRVLLVVIVDGYNGVCGPADTNHGACADANTTVKPLLY